jgi:N-acetylglucosaminyldiphosphoundecaprenol N-acetyl-beta-D-mannosaminyltransferase
VNDVDLLGVRVDAVSLDDAVGRVTGLIDAQRFGHVVTANVDFLHQAGHDEKLRDIMIRADLVVADGVPLLWMARWQGTPLPERVNGTDLTIRLCEVAAARGWRICLVGGQPGVAKRAADTIATRWSADVVGATSPSPLTMDDPERGAGVADWIRDNGTTLLLLAMGGGRQEHWIDRYRDRLGPCVAMGVGSAIDFIAGTRRRAPEVLQRHGLEWAWRLGAEPTRMWHRYLVDDPRVFARFAVQRLVRG